MLDDDNEENLPETSPRCLAAEVSKTYPLLPFIPVSESDDDKTTTVSDLAILNNQLALCHQAMFSVDNLPSLCALSATVCRLIETRRKVKKLEYGAVNTAKSGRVFEVLE